MKTLALLLLLMLCCGVSTSLYATARQAEKSSENPAKAPAKYVILITIDGMRKDMITDTDMPAPTLKAMAHKGLFVEQVNCIAPSSTYPSHTSLVTGARPVNHGIYYNAPFMGNVDSKLTYWYADSIRTQTIWGAAKAAGLTTCSLFWPVSTGAKEIDYNIPEYWSTEPVADQVQFVKEHCTPRGLMDEVEENATGKLTTRSFNPSTRNREGRTGYMAAYILEKYRPNLTTIHFISTDAYQHATGLHSQQTKQALSAVDYGIGQIVEGLERTGMIDSTAIIVTGDHGFIDTDRLISPNVWLTEAGLLTADKEQWKAKFHGAGATMFLYLRQADDSVTLRSVRAKLNALPAEKRGLFRIVERQELVALGCSPDVALAVEPVRGVAVATNTTGADVTLKKGGKHGYLTPYDPTTMLAFGQGIPAGKIINTLNITDIAPLVMHLLGVPFVAADGKFDADTLRK